MKTKTFYRQLFICNLVILSLVPTTMFSQNLVGMWTGKVYTTDKNLPYEVAISEKNGKLTGYSYTTFTVKGEEMVAVKSIEVRKEKGKIIIEDEDLVFNSFDEESPKQLKQTNTLELEVVNDKTMLLIGTFKTLKTKTFRSLSGGVRLRKDSIIDDPRLIAKLDEMDLSKSLSFLQPPVTASAESDVATLDKVSTAIEKPTAVPPIAAPAPTIKAPAPATRPVIAPLPPTPPPVAVAKPAVKPAPPSTAPVAKAPPVAVAKPVPAKPAPVATKPAAPPKPLAAVTPPVAVAPVKKPVASNAFNSNFAGRTIETIQTVAFKSDSITLTLYDNGEVDGDTVSVFLNGKPILSKQRLSTNAITYTIYVTPDLGDSLQLIMYAENLGSIPPNSGLLIIKDGRDRYEIRFAGDLTKNAAITLRRKQPLN